MKKLFAAAISIFVLVSCSSDDDSTPSASPTHGNPDPNTILVKKIVRTYPLGYQMTSTYVYDGTQVTSIINSDGTHEEYEYNDAGLPTSHSIYQGDHLGQVKYFHYDGDGQLKTYITSYTSGISTTRTEYAYEEDGSVTAERFTGALTADDHWSDLTFTLENGNVVHVNEFTYSTDNYNYGYTYDDKNAYDKNISGKSTLDLANWKGGAANPVQLAATYSNGGQQPSDYGSWTTTYTYNSGNYPVTATETHPDGVIQIQYFYE